MIKYHKIQTIFKRDPETGHKTLLDGQFSIPEFEYLQNNIWDFSEKFDGTNIRVMFDGEKLTFGGKTDDAQIPAKLVNKLYERFFPQIGLFKTHFPDGVCLYGEGVGAGIPKSGNYGSEQDFVLFDVLIGDWWLERKNVKTISEGFKIPIVPIIGTGTFLDMIKMVKAGFNSNWGSFLAEGIVARPVCELKARNGNRIITKLKHKDFAIKSKPPIRGWKKIMGVNEHE